MLTFLLLFFNEDIKLSKQTNLDKQFTEKEIEEAINNLSIGKFPTLYSWEIDQNIHLVRDLQIEMTKQQVLYF